jgi:hypothetical protein
VRKHRRPFSFVIHDNNRSLSRSDNSNQCFAFTRILSSPFDRFGNGRGEPRRPFSFMHFVVDFDFPSCIGGIPQRRIRVLRPLVRFLMLGDSPLLPFGRIRVVNNSLRPSCFPSTPFRVFRIRILSFRFPLSMCNLVYIYNYSRFVVYVNMFT